MLSHALPTRLRLSPLLVTRPPALAAGQTWMVAGGAGAMAPCLPPLMACEA